MPIKEPSEIEQAAALLRQRNVLDQELAGLIHRPVTRGHVGEWIASRVFDIALHQSAAQPASDGYFQSGSLRGKSVNVKFYAQQSGLLDMTTTDAVDYYLVLAGPTGAAGSSVGTVQPWCISAVYVFDAHRLRTEQERRDARIGVASSVPQRLWHDAEVHPGDNNSAVTLTPDQRRQLQLFAPAGLTEGVRTSSRHPRE